MYMAACFRTGDYQGVVQAIEAAPLDQIDEYDIVAYAYASYKLDDPSTNRLIDEARKVAPYLDDFIDYVDMNYNLRHKNLWRAHRIALTAASRWKRVDKTTVFTYANSVLNNHPSIAIEVLKAALPNMAREDSARAFLLMGKAYRKAGNVSLATHYFKMTLIDYPETPYSIGAARYLKDYRTAKAKAYFFNRKYTTALKYAPSYSDVRLMVYYKKGRYSSFMRRYNPKKKHDPRVYLYAARIYKRKGQFLRARREYLKALDAKDEDVRKAAVLELSNLIIRKRDFVGYSRMKSKLRNPDQFQSLRIGITAYALRKKGDAIKYLEKAASSDESRFWKTAALFWLYKITHKRKYRVQASRTKTYSYYTLRAYKGKVLTTDYSRWIQAHNPRYSEHAKRGKFFSFIGFILWAIDEAKMGGLATGYDIGRYAQSIGDYQTAIATASVTVDNARSPVPKEVLKIAYPCLFHSWVTKHSRAYRLSKGLLLGLMREESRFMHTVVSRAGAVGLTQVMPKTAKKVWRKIKPGSRFHSKVLRNPDTNIKIGAYHLKELLSVFKNEIYALAAYNAGKGRVVTWKQYLPFADTDLFVEMIPFKETRGYVKRVMRSAYIYKAICE